MIVTAAQDHIDPGTAGGQHLPEGFVNGVELFLGKHAARDFGLIGADGHVETRAVQTGDSLGDAWQQFEIVGSLDVGGTVHDHDAVAIEQEQRHHRNPGWPGDAGSTCRACRASCGTTNQKATSTTKTPPATARLGSSLPTTSHTSR